VRVGFSRRFSIYPVEAAYFRRTLETVMASPLHLQQTTRSTVDPGPSVLRAIARAVVSHHALALRAASIAASPRQGMAEVRAMYVPPLATPQ
jgi:hypothetical protein